MTVPFWYPAEQLPELLAVLKRAGAGAWLRDPRMKYLNIRIDTREGGFSLKDRNGIDVHPSEVRAWADGGVRS